MNSTPPRSADRRPGRDGFTLLELVVVMAILVILAGVAVHSMEGLDQQARFDATTRTLQELRDGVAAVPARQDDGSITVNGFVADIGRLPRAVGDDPASQLAELWSNPRNLAPFAIRPAPSDGEVLIGAGWRGGYLRLGVAQDDLRDGWGRPFDLLTFDGAPAADNTEVAVVRSRGADGLVDAAAPAGYDADLAVAISGGTAESPAGCQTTVSGRVYWIDNGQLVEPDPANGSVTVRCFGPDPATGLVAEQTVTVTAPFDGGVAFSFVSTPGPRVIRAYQGEFRSLPVRLTIPPGGMTKDLVLR